MVPFPRTTPVPPGTKTRRDTEAVNHENELVEVISFGGTQKNNSGNGSDGALPSHHFCSSWYNFPPPRDTEAASQDS